MNFSITIFKKRQQLSHYDTHNNVFFEDSWNNTVRLEHKWTFFISLNQITNHEIFTNDFTNKNENRKEKNIVQSHPLTCRHIFLYSIANFRGLHKRSFFTLNVSIPLICYININIFSRRCNVCCRQG